MSALKFLTQHQDEEGARETLSWVSEERTAYLTDDEAHWVRDHIHGPRP